MTFPESADDSEQAELIDALVQASFATMAVLSRVAADHELSLTQLRVLAILRDRRLRMAGLADYLGLDRSTMSGLVDRAEKRGLLRRAANVADGRAVDVLLTPDGRALTDELYTTITRALAPMTDSLAAPDQRRLQTLLTRMLTG